MKLLLTAFIIAFQAVSTFSQIPGNTPQSFQHKNSFQAELFGHGLFYSLNYERVIVNGPRFKTTGQAGASYYPPQAGIITVWMPVMINELLSFGRHS